MPSKIWIGEEPDGKGGWRGIYIVFRDDVKENCENLSGEKGAEQ